MLSPTNCIPAYVLSACNQCRSEDVGIDLSVALMQIEQPVSQQGACLLSAVLNVRCIQWARCSGCWRTSWKRRRSSCCFEVPDADRSAALGARRTSTSAPLRLHCRGATCLLLCHKHGMLTVIIILGTRLCCCQRSLSVRPGSRLSRQATEVLLRRMFGFVHWPMSRAEVQTLAAALACCKCRMLSGDSSSTRGRCSCVRQRRTPAL